jgi:hypothetical protein
MKSLIRKILREDKDWHFMDDDPLESVGGEIFIDFNDLSYEDRLVVFENLENEIGELNFQIGSHGDTKNERKESCANIRHNSILLHCGHEDNEYRPTKNDICCMSGSYEKLESESHEYHGGGVTYINGRDLLDTQPMFESEDKDWDFMDDISNEWNAELLPHLPDEIVDLFKGRGHNIMFNRVIIKLNTNEWFEYSNGFYSDPTWEKLNYSEDPIENVKIIFDQDADPYTIKDKRCKIVKKYLIGEEIPVEDVYLGDV